MRRICRASPRSALSFAVVARLVLRRARPHGAVRHPDRRGRAACFLIGAVNDGVRNVARLDDPAAPADPTTLGWAVVVERALRAVLIIAAALIMARAWGINLGDIAMGETA